MANLALAVQQRRVITLNDVVDVKKYTGLGNQVSMGYYLVHDWADFLEIDNQTVIQALTDGGGSWYYPNQQDPEYFISLIIPL